TFCLADATPHPALRATFSRKGRRDRYRGQGANRRSDFKLRPHTMLRHALTPRFAALTLAVLLTFAFAVGIVASGLNGEVIAGFLFFFALVALGVHDFTQEKHAI